MDCRRLVPDFTDWPLKDKTIGYPLSKVKWLAFDCCIKYYFFTDGGPKD